jgi:hypothetical protein
MSLTCRFALKSWRLILCSLVATTVLFAAEEQIADYANHAEKQQPNHLEQALRVADLGNADLAFSLLPEKKDSLRLKRVDEVLFEGLRIDDWANELALDLEAVDFLDQLHQRLAFEIERVGSASKVKTNKEKPIGARPWRTWIKKLRSMAKHSFMDSLSCAEMQDVLLGLLKEDERSEKLTVFELDSLERASRETLALRVDFLQNLELPDPQEINSVLSMADRIFIDIHFLAAAAASRKTFIHDSWGEIYYADDLVLIGSSADNHYRGKLPPVVIDLGGNDVYENNAALSHGNLGLLFDLEGNDVYMADDGPGIAYSCGGLSLLIDTQGNDRYHGDFSGLGAALGGVAFLIDQQGNDHYDGDTFCLGAGSLGIGALVDGGGSDLYSSALYGQGFGHLAGIGLLQDHEGEDVYLMRPQYVDLIRYNDHHVTLGQGFGYGLRPELSGGIGMLLDLDGNDMYSCDIYGQGAAYWWSLGALVDRHGNDRYLAYQYSQGSGIHLAGGVLLDDKGVDYYISNGVSQGCGHDLAIGVLKDSEGRDSYLCEGLSLGAGSANGTGILLDLQGNDLFAMREQKNTLGYGNPRRNSGSTGIFADFGGEDIYTLNGAADSLWRGSKMGFGMDLSAEMSAELFAQVDTISSQEIAEKPRAPFKSLDPLFKFNDSIGNLYIWSIRLEPQWAAERDSARVLLNLRSTELLEFLANGDILESKISWERHALKSILLELGEKALPLFARELDSLNSRGAGLSLWVLSLEKDIAEVDFFLDLLKTEEEIPDGIWSYILENLALRVDVNSFEDISATLQNAMYHKSAKVRRSAAWGLGKIKPSTEGRRMLMSALGDETNPVRISAYFSLLNDSLVSAKIIEEEIAAIDNNCQHVRLLLRILAKMHPERAYKLLERINRNDPLWLEKQWLLRELNKNEKPANITG